MINLTARNEVLEKKEIIQSHLTDMQHCFADDNLLQEYKDSNEEAVFWQLYDCYGKTKPKHESYFKIISPGLSDLATFTEELSPRLKKLLEFLGVKRLVLMAFVRSEIFGGKHSDYPPLENAYQMLENIVGSRTYKEAILFDLEDLPTMVEILFWLTRCDPEVPEFLLVFDEEEKMNFNICKYGNLHITEMGKEKLTPKKLKSLGWELIEGREKDPFTEDGAIAGRTIRLD